MRVNDGFEIREVETTNEKTGVIEKRREDTVMSDSVPNPGVEGLDTSSIITGRELLEVLGQINSAFSQKLNASLNDIVGFKLDRGPVAISPNIQILSTEAGDLFPQGPVDSLDKALNEVLNPNN